MTGAALRKVRVSTILLLLASLALVASPRRVAAQDAERTLTLEEAIALALEKNEDITIERESLTSAEAAVSGAKGAYDPFLELEAGLREASEPSNSAFSGAPEGKLAPTTKTKDAGVSVRQYLPTGGSLSVRADAGRETNDGSFAMLSPAYDSRVGVELRQPLLKGRSVDAARLRIRVASSGHKGAVASLRRAITENVADVEEAYWALVAARREVEVREEAVRLAEEQLSETQARIESGVAPQTEIAQPRAELERRRGELIGARQEVSRAENALKLLILGDDDGTLWVERFAPVEDSDAQIETVDVAASMERALEIRPEVEVAQAAVERRRAEAAFARNGVQPSLDAVVSYDRFGLAGERNPSAATISGDPAEIPPELEGDFDQSLETLGDGDFDDARVGLVFGFPIGNREARAAARSARSVERQAEAELTRTRKTIRAEVLDAAAALETAGQRIESARAGRGAAEVQLMAEREQYAVGLSTNFLVLTRQNDLSRARLEEISALTDYRTARTEMARATGTLLEERHIEME